MYITQVDNINNKIVAYCVGDEIKADEKYTSIEDAEGKRLSVEKCSYMVSFSGQKSMLMSFFDVTKEEDVAIGEAKLFC